MGHQHLSILIILLTSIIFSSCAERTVPSSSTSFSLSSGMMAVTASENNENHPFALGVYLIAREINGEHDAFEIFLEDDHKLEIPNGTWIFELIGFNRFADAFCSQRIRRDLTGGEMSIDVGLSRLNCQETPRLNLKAQEVRQQTFSPNSVENFRASFDQDNQRVELSWEHPKAKENVEIKDYHITRYSIIDGNKTPQDNFKVNSNENRFLDSDVEAGHDYIYSIYAQTYINIISEKVFSQDIHIHPPQVQLSFNEDIPETIEAGECINITLNLSRALGEGEDLSLTPQINGVSAEYFNDHSCETDIVSRVDFHQGEDSKTFYFLADQYHYINDGLNIDLNLTSSSPNLSVQVPDHHHIAVNGESLELKVIYLNDPGDDDADDIAIPTGGYRDVGLDQEFFVRAYFYNPENGQKINTDQTIQLEYAHQGNFAFSINDFSSANNYTAQEPINLAERINTVTPVHPTYFIGESLNVHATHGINEVSGLVKMRVISPSCDPIQYPFGNSERVNFDHTLHPRTICTLNHFESLNNLANILEDDNTHVVAETVFLLTQDIDFTDFVGTLTGETAVVENFEHTLLGKGADETYSLKHFTSEGSLGDEVKSLFGVLQYNGLIGEPAKIAHLRLDHIQINQPNKTRVGALVGFNKGIITNINLKNIQVSGDNEVGGLVGRSGGAYASVRNATFEDITISGHNHVGGAIGFVGQGETYKRIILKEPTSQANNIVSGTNNVGGILGSFNPNAAGGTRLLQSAVMNAEITGTQNVGGLVGYLEINDIFESFVGENTTLNSSSEGGTPIYFGGLAGFVKSTDHGRPEIKDSYSHAQFKGQLNVSNTGAFIGHVIDNSGNNDSPPVLATNYSDIGSDGDFDFILDPGATMIDGHHLYLVSTDSISQIFDFSSNTWLEPHDELDADDKESFDFMFAEAGHIEAPWVFIGNRPTLRWAYCQFDPSPDLSLCPKSP